MNVRRWIAVLLFLPAAALAEGNAERGKKALVERSFVPAGWSKAQSMVAAKRGRGISLKLADTMIARLPRLPR